MRKPQKRHAQWSASSTERNWLCPGNLAISEDLPARPSNQAAEWGTACHTVAERLLKKDVPVDIGDEIETERSIFYVDQEMMDCAWVYVDYIRDRLKAGFNLHAVEQNFTLKSLALPMDIGGTADAVLHNPFDKVLEIVDLKTGKGGFVKATGNPQERLYALGVLTSLNLNSVPVQTVMTTIVQPRYAGSEAVRWDAFHVAELMDWTIDLVPRVTLAAEALKTYATARENSVLLDLWVDDFLVPGETQCTYCPAAGGCPALRKRALEIAGQDGVTYKPNTFAQNSVAAVENDLDMFEQLEAWIRERRALAHEMAVQGTKFDHHVLVDKIGHRKFAGVNEADTVAKIRAVIPLDDDSLFDRKLKSPAGLEKAIGKKAVETHLGDLIIRPVTGTDLIRTTNTSRTAAATVADFITELE
jgi:hypothetical protein